MKIKVNYLMAFVVMLMMAFMQVAIPQQAEARHRRPVTYVNYGNYGNYGYGHFRRPGIYQRHPIISRTLTGTALGAVTGLAVGAIAGRGRAGRGALIGAGVGTAAGFGYGLYRNKQYTGRFF